MQSTNSQYLDPHTIQVQSLQWSEMSEWDRWGSVHSASTHAFHRLSEMGKTSNGYQYEVLVDPQHVKYPLKILKVVLRPTCCKHLGRCPIGKEAIPDHPCRGHLRKEAMRMAYEVWVQYLNTLAGKH